MSAKTNVWLVSSLALSAATARAQTVTVTISSDIVDIDWQTATIADLPGPDGEVSFSEAMIATNNTPGHQTVGFAIPQSDWQLQFVLPGRAVLVSVTGYFFRAYDEVTIDGTTQTAFTGDTNPDGWEVAIYGNELYLNADSCTLIGFDSTHVSANGSNGLVQGNTGSMNISLYGGSASLIQGNTGGTIKIDRSSDNVVVGNTVSRVRVLGWMGGGQPAASNRIGGPDPGDRNFITGYGTWNSEGYPGGTTVQLFDSVGTLIENNWIGTTPDGLAQGSLASVVGVGFEGENRDTVLRGNRIAGILGHGTGPHAAGLLFGWAILVGGSGSGITVVGNTIGLDADDEPVLGSVFGIDVGNVITSPANVSDIRIGGAGAGEGNVIAGHLFNGITVGRDVPQVRISGNSIFANSSLGIDLVPVTYGYGVTPNDPLDLDAGGNGLQNFPDLAGAVLQAAGLRVTGALHTSPLGSFTIELFASPGCHTTGFGEGQVFLGSTSVSTDAAGDAGFDVLLPAAPAGWVVTATATLEPLGATSEHSACATILLDTPPDLGTSYCGPAVPNSSGAPAVLTATGSPLVAANDVTLRASDLPAGRFGYFLASRTRGSFQPPGSQGSLCLAGDVGRYNHAAQVFQGPSGSLGLDLTSVPVNPPAAVAPGETWNFQCWFRDVNPGQTSNFTDARAITFI